MNNDAVIQAFRAYHNGSFRHLDDLIDTIAKAQGQTTGATHPLWKHVTALSEAIHAEAKLCGVDVYAGLR